MVEVFKIVRGFETIDEVKFFQRRVGIKPTRGHEFKII